MASVMITLIQFVRLLAAVTSSVAPRASFTLQLEILIGRTHAHPRDP